MRHLKTIGHGRILQDDPLKTIDTLIDTNGCHPFRPLRRTQNHVPARRVTSNNLELSPRHRRLRREEPPETYWRIPGLGQQRLSMLLPLRRQILPLEGSRQSNTSSPRVLLP